MRLARVADAPTGVTMPTSSGRTALELYDAELTRLRSQPSDPHVDEALQGARPIWVDLRVVPGS
jgi:hypothetical protein